MRQIAHLLFWNSTWSFERRHSSKTRVLRVRFLPKWNIHRAYARHSSFDNLPRIPPTAEPSDGSSRGQENPAWRPRGRSIKVKRHKRWPGYSTRSRWRFRNSSVCPHRTWHLACQLHATLSSFSFSLPIEITHFPRLCEPLDAKLA